MRNKSLTKIKYSVKKKLSFLAILSGFLFFPSCSSDTHPSSGTVVCSDRNWFQSENLRVLCTTSQVGDIVASVAGPDASVLVLICGDLDPHSYQLVKGDDEKLEAAHVVFASGLGLEHGPSLQQFLMNNSKVVRLGDLLKKDQTVHLIQVDGQLDPHIWLDVSIWKKTIRPIAETLIHYLPESRGAIEQRAKILEEKLESLDQKILSTLHQISAEKRYLVTSHDAFQYFTRRYLASDEERASGLWNTRLCAPEGLAPEGQLGLSDIQRVLTFCQDHRVQVLFPESNVNTSPLKKVVDTGRQLGLSLRLSGQPLYGDTMQEDGQCDVQDAYQIMMETNCRTIASEWAKESS